jgi:hypothetical protein
VGYLFATWVICLLNNTRDSRLITKMMLLLLLLLPHRYGNNYFLFY